jgi:pimeloyl-ACP methyl ester carboxylesterase
LGGEVDATIPEHAGRRAAAGYKADYVMIEKAGHNLMMEHNYRETAELICNWLEETIGTQRRAGS